MVFGNQSPFVCLSQIFRNTPTVEKHSCKSFLRQPYPLSSRPQKKDSGDSVIRRAENASIVQSSQTVQAKGFVLLSAILKPLSCFYKVLFTKFAGLITYS